MNEQWKDIAGYNGLYQVSDHGRVRSLKLGREVIITGSTRDGYRTVGISVDSKKNKVSRSVQRLVAEAFIPNPENKRVVHHKDCNRKNNHVDNLQWATHKENSVGVFEKGNKSKMLKYIERSKVKTLGELIDYIKSH